MFSFSSEQRGGQRSRRITAAFSYSGDGYDYGMDEADRRISFCVLSDRMTNPSSSTSRGELCMEPSHGDNRVAGLRVSLLHKRTRTDHPAVQKRIHSRPLLYPAHLFVTGVNPE